MKARFLALAALVLGLASCQNDFEAGNAVVGGEVDFQLSVDANELATRAGQDGADTQNAKDSAFGAIDYFQSTDWSSVDLRYSLEVYDAKADFSNTTEVLPVKDRLVIIKDSYEPVVFNLRLAPNREYRFVVFADFVKEGSSVTVNDKTMLEHQAGLGLHHTIGADLRSITIKDDAINEECTDAYFAFEDIEITNSAAKDIVLRRPYGKVRVIATDLAELNLNVDPKAVKVTYTAKHPQTFNAVTGVVGEVETVDYEFDYIYGNISKNSLAEHYYTAGYDAKTVENANGNTRHSHITLFTDYILAEPTSENAPVQTPYHFTMAVYDNAAMADTNLIKETAFTTDIPVERNHLTTVIGNVLTTATEVEVTINDNFANVDDNNTTNDHDFTLLETLMNGGTFTLTEDLTITEPTWLKGDAIINLNGHTLNYVASKDDNNHTIMTRVENGSSLRFVGEGAVVSNGYIASANEGGKIYVDGGNYSGETCTLFQANGGEVYISGGVFQAAEYNGDYRFTLNHVDSKKDVGTIEVTGGKFYKYNPAESASENPVDNFVKDGFASLKDGDWFEVYYVGTNLTIDAVVTNPTQLKAALEDANVNVVYLKSGIYGTIIAKSGKTIIGSTAADVECVALNGADNVTLINIEFDAADAKVAYDGKGNGKQYANILSGDANKNASGSYNLVIDGCKFTGTFALADGGVAIAFTDQGRGSGQSGNITIKNCTFETKNGYYDIYCHYSGKDKFVIENNVFNSEIQVIPIPGAITLPIYLGRYQSNTPVVVKGNTFARCATFEDAAYIQAHSTAYSVLFDASNNTYAN